MNERNYAWQFQVSKRVISHGSRCFGDEAPIPVIGMQSIPDLDFSRYFRMMVKTTVTNDCVCVTGNNRKLRRHTRAIPTHYFFDKSHCLFSFGKNA